MGLMKRMASVATECLRTPGRDSVWSEEFQRYICERNQEFERVARDQRQAISQGHSPIGSSFKLIFGTAAAGTVLFTLICVAATLLAGRDPPPLLEKVVMSLADLAKIGFGAIVGMLGAQSQRTASAAPPAEKR